MEQVMTALRNFLSLPHPTSREVSRTAHWNHNAYEWLLRSAIEMPGDITEELTQKLS